MKFQGYQLKPARFKEIISDIVLGWNEVDILLDELLAQLLNTYPGGIGCITINNPLDLDGEKRHDALLCVILGEYDECWKPIDDVLSLLGNLNGIRQNRNDMLHGILKTSKDGLTGHWKRYNRNLVLNEIKAKTIFQLMLKETIQLKQLINKL